MSRPLLSVLLAEAKAASRSVLVGYLPAGYPDRQRYAAAVRCAFDAGLTALEVGMPGPAPDLDGPIIQRASELALAAVPTVEEALAASNEALAGDGVLIALGFRHTLEAVGFEAFARVLVDQGFRAVLMPEFPMAEQLLMAERVAAFGLEQVLFLYLEEDLAMLSASRLQRPILYLQSADLRTGGSFNPGKARERLAELDEAMAGKPYYVLVGFGIRGAEEARVAIRAGADGAIIGTRLVAAADEGEAAVSELIGAAVATLGERGLESVRAVDRP